MRLLVQIVIVAALAALLALPAAAQPGNAGGKGNGKPAWAGKGNGKPPWAGGGGGPHGKGASGKPGASGGGKPAWAGKGRGGPNGAESDERGENGKGSRAPGPPADLPAQAADNPAKVCAAQRALDPEAFAEAHGTIENKANAFGKCVSSVAKARGGDEEAGEGDAEEPGDDPAECEPAEEPAAEEGPGPDEQCPADEGEDEGGDGEADEQTGEVAAAVARVLAVLRLLF